MTILDIASHCRDTTRDSIFNGVASEYAIGALFCCSEIPQYNVLVASN